MKLENQVCSYEQAKTLKKLGVIQDSLFYHTNSDKWGVMPRKSIDFTGNPHSAFTVAELGIMLPTYYPSWRFKKDNVVKYITTVITKDEVKNGKTITTEPKFDRYENTEAQSRAQMLIDLLENGVINVEDINSRLTESNNVDALIK